MKAERITVGKIAKLDAQQIAEILAGPAHRAAQWIAEAARNGITEAQAVYGHLLLWGKGVETDPAAALTWFKHAAQADHALAMNMVGRCYELGWGTTACLEVAVYWYRLSANAGLDWGMYNYATALSLGRGVAMDRAEALMWFRRAAAMGHAKSHNYIGSFYEDGWVVTQDRLLALGHYRIAAEGGDFRGRFNYARLLAASGEWAKARFWMNRMLENATPEFLEKARRAFSASPFETLWQPFGTNEASDVKEARP